MFRRSLCPSWTWRPVQFVLFCCLWIAPWQSGTATFFVKVKQRKNRSHCPLQVISRLRSCSNEKRINSVGNNCNHDVCLLARIPMTQWSKTNRPTARTMPQSSFLKDVSVHILRIPIGSAKCALIPLLEDRAVGSVGSESTPGFERSKLVELYLAHNCGDRVAAYRASNI